MPLQIFFFLKLHRNKRRGKEKDNECNLNSLETTTKYGMNVSDIWHAEIRGLMIESTPCYTYSSDKKFDIGFGNSVNK